MNRQEIKMEGKATELARSAPVGRPRQGGRKKPSESLLRLLRGSMLAIAALIVFVGLSLIVLPMFRVQTIEVEGCSIYTPEEIKEASGIEVGQELFAIDKHSVIENIWQFDQPKYIKEVTVVSSLSSIRIVVTEHENVRYTQFNGGYISFDREFRVLEEAADDTAFSSFLYVTLPEGSSAAVGETICFENAELELSYVNELIDTLADRGVLSSVTALDVSRKYRVSYTMGTCCRVELGKVDDTARKLAVVDQILSLKGESSTLPSVVDVSDLQKPTYRALPATELLEGENG